MVHWSCWLTLGILGPAWLKRPQDNFKFVFFEPKWLQLGANLGTRWTQIGSSQPAWGNLEVILKPLEPCRTQDAQSHPTWPMHQFKHKIKSNIKKTKPLQHSLCIISGKNRSKLQHTLYIISNKYIKEYIKIQNELIDINNYSWRRFQIQVLHNNRQHNKNYIPRYPKLSNMTMHHPRPGGMRGTVE